MNPKEAIKVISVLTAAYPNMNISQETIEIYIRFLADISFDVGQAVALKIISQSEFFPSVAKFRENVLKILPNEIPGMEAAWAEVTDNFHSTGSWGTPVFSNPIIDKAVQALGWRELCLSENTMADRAHFFKIYENYRKRGVEDSLQLPEIKMLKEKILKQIGENKCP